MKKSARASATSAGATKRRRQASQAPAREEERLPDEVARYAYGTYPLNVIAVVLCLVAVGLFLRAPSAARHWIDETPAWLGYSWFMAALVATAVRERLARVGWSKLTVPAARLRFWMTVLSLTLVVVPLVYMSGLDSFVAVQFRRLAPSASEWAIKLGSSVLSWACSGVIGSATWELLKWLVRRGRRGSSKAPASPAELRVPSEGDA